MYIHEAIKATTESRPFITRKSWIVDDSEKSMVKILPTSTPDCCIMVSDFSKMRPSRCWQPRKDDLTADDWFPCHGSLKVNGL